MAWFEFVWSFETDGNGSHIEEHGLTIWILCDSEHSVGRFSLIVPLKPASNGHGSNRMRLVFVESPTSDIKLMCPLIIEISIACFPKPVPFVMNVVRMICIDHGRSLPEAPVQFRGRRTRVIGTDSVAIFAAVAVGDF